VRGTLVCWQAGGAIPPRIVANKPTPHHYSVQLGDAAAQHPALSVLSQTFLLPPNLKASALHVNFLLEVTTAVHKQGAATCKSACASATPAYPRLTVTGPGSRPIAQASLLPRRTRVWSGLRVPLPICVKGTTCADKRLTLSLTLPPQPPGIRVVLYVNDIHLGV
jgi:hypothetical protein